MVDMVRVELGGESREVAADSWTEAADELVAKYGGVPKVTPIGNTEPAPVYDIPAGATVGGVALLAGPATAADIVAAINGSPLGGRTEVVSPSTIMSSPLKV